MATTLKKTNVVIIGLGAAGGVACLPLARAGLEVIGLEAGNWLSTKDMAPDRTNGAYLQKTTLPYEDNYLDLDPTMKDPLGDNPETNVVDRWGFSHEAPNLGILGGSVMGTSGARNPTETLQALAWRTAEYLAKNWKSIAT